MKKSTVLFALLLFVSSFTFAQSNDYSFKESYKVTSPTFLSVVSSNSNMDVVAHPGNDIVVEFAAFQNGKLLEVSKDELEDLMKRQARLEIDQTEDGLKIGVRSINQSNYVSAEKSIVIHFKIYVPDQTSCSLISSDGSLSISGLKPDQKCITNDGDISLSDIDGDIIAKTNDGDITLANIDGRVSTETSDGKVITDLQTTKTNQ